MTNTVNQQPTAVSLQLTDYLLGWQGSQSPPTRKVPVSALNLYYAPLTGATFTGAVTVSSGGIVVSSGGIAITGNSSFATKVTIQSADAASTQPLRADQTWQIIATYSPSSAASQVFPLSSSFRRFRVTLHALTVDTSGANLNLNFSNDGGVTYLTTANYAYAQSNVNAAGTTTGSGSAADTKIGLFGGAFTNAADIDGTFEIFPGSASLAARIRGNIHAPNSTPAYQYTAFGGSWTGPLALMNYARIQASTGLMTGSIILEGLP